MVNLGLPLGLLGETPGGEAGRGLPPDWPDCQSERVSWPRPSSTGMEEPRGLMDPRRLAAVRLGLFSGVDLVVTAGGLVACSSRRQAALTHLVLRR